MTRRERWIPYAFLLPAFLGLLIFQLVPIVFGLGRSLYATGFGELAGRLNFVGLQNFRDLFADPVFWNALKVTLLFNLIVNPLQIGLALGVAILLNAKLRGIGLFRVLFYLPVGVSLTVTTIIWGLLLNPDSGLVNGLLTRLGLPAQPFFQDPSQALLSLILLVTWKGVAYWMLILLAGLQSIPRSLYEAADVDGASGLQAFRSVTLPLMRRPLSFVLVSDTVVNFLLFGPVYILTKGGPQGSTHLLMYEAFRSGFIGIDLGRATAVTAVIFVFVATLVALQTWLLREDR